MTPAVTASVVLPIPVPSGLPFSSSSACAPIPTARKNATSVPASRHTTSGGITAAPITTYDRCQRVYGGWSSVTQSPTPPVPRPTA